MLAVICALTLVFFIVNPPETKGESLEEMAHCFTQDVAEVTNSKLMLTAKTITVYDDMAPTSF